MRTLNSIFSFRKCARYHEIDAQAVVYNAHYLTYFDLALTEFMKAQGVDLKPGGSHEFHVVKGEVNYKKPIRLDEIVDIHICNVKAGRSSLTFQLEIHAADICDLRAYGEVVWVWTDQNTGTSTPMPETMKAALIRPTEAN